MGDGGGDGDGGEGGGEGGDGGEGDGEAQRVMPAQSIPLEPHALEATLAEKTVWMEALLQSLREVAS